MMHQGSLALLLLTFLIIAGSIPAIAHADVSVTITPSSADTTTFSSNPTYHGGGTNYVFSAAFAAGYPNLPDTFMWFGFVMFDISSHIPSMVTIVSAYLELYHYHGYVDSGYGPSLTISVYRVDSSWDETLDWNHNPTIESTATNALTFDPSSSGSYRSWDVTQDVQNFVSGTATNYGWCVKISEGGSIDFVSKEGSTHGLEQYPQLIITYVPSSVVPEYSYGALLATAACFAAYAFVKRSKLNIIRR
jgi:hypothetical protein